VSPMTCPRAWEAEAIEDGRLHALGAASFERHIAQCDECAREANDLRELGEAFGRLEPRRLSLLEQRRRRAELLRRANERVVTRRNGPQRSMEAAALAALVALVLVVAGLHRWHAPAAGTSTAPVFELRAIGGASFHDETSGPHGHVVLSSGSLAVHVEHLSAGQSFVLGIPDGELEVRGTRFIVGVGGGHTERVLVTEGVVAVRLSGSLERTLGAGESWARPVLLPPAAGSNPLVDAVNDVALGREARDADGLGSAVHFPRNSASTRTQHGGAAADGRRIASPRAGSDDALATAPPGSSEPAATARATAAREFAGAMAAFTAGAYLDADERFSAFAARFPSDARREDATFLRAVIATTRGDAAAAVARARDYLRRFPGGLRRAEMERLVSAPW
jgi:hypothetical protein